MLVIAGLGWDSTSHWGSYEKRHTICVCKACQVLDGTGLELAQVANEWQTGRFGDGQRLGHCLALGDVGGMLISLVVVGVSMSAGVERSQHVRCFGDELKAMMLLDKMLCVCPEDDSRRFTIRRRLQYIAEVGKSRFGGERSWQTGNQAQGTYQIPKQKKGIGGRAPQAAQAG